jgi:integral membrane protein
LNSLRTFRYVALIEATSFLALLVATYVKYHDHSPTGVQVLGPVHGAMFLAYVLITLNVRSVARWSTRATLGVLLGAVLPFGGYAVERWICRSTQPSAACPEAQRLTTLQYRSSGLSGACPRTPWSRLGILADRPPVRAPDHDPTRALVGRGRRGCNLGCRGCLPETSDLSYGFPCGGLASRVGISSSA